MGNCSTPYGAHGPNLHPKGPLTNDGVLHTMYGARSSTEYVHGTTPLIKPAPRSNYVQTLVFRPRPALRPLFYGLFYWRAGWRRSGGHPDPVGRGIPHQSTCIDALSQRRAAGSMGCRPYRPPGCISRRQGLPTYPTGAIRARCTGTLAVGSIYKKTSNVAEASSVTKGGTETRAPLLVPCRSL